VVVPEPQIQPEDISDRSHQSLHHHHQSSKKSYFGSFFFEISSKSSDISGLSAANSSKKMFWGLFERQSNKSNDDHDVYFHQTYRDMVPPLSINAWRDISHIHHSSRSKSSLY
jgi:hypothetical protein